LIAGWNYNTLDRAIFPTRGVAHSINFEAGVPFGKNKLQYYRGTYTGFYYHPIYKSFIAHLNAEFGYGNGYGSMTDLPFFKNFYSGGIGSVRGFRGNTLGPLDSTNNPIGGNVLAQMTFALIIPNPFEESLRTSLFVDAGNVFYRRIKLSDIRSSAGVQAEWRTPLGMVLTFSLAKPINKKAGDRLDAFQFNLGASL